MPIVNKTRARIINNHTQIINNHTQIIKGKKQIGAGVCMQWIAQFTKWDCWNHLYHSHPHAYMQLNMQLQFEIVVLIFIWLKYKSSIEKSHVETNLMTWNKQAQCEIIIDIVPSWTCISVLIGIKRRAPFDSVKKLTLGLQIKLNWTSSKRDTRIVAMSLSKEFDDPWQQVNPCYYSTRIMTTLLWCQKSCGWSLMKSVMTRLKEKLGNHHHL